MQLSKFKQIRFLSFLSMVLIGCSPGEAPPVSGAPAEPVVIYDKLLLNGTIVDGTGAARYLGDVAVTAGRIAAIGELDGSSANEIVDLTGLVLAPGFIDTHNHADRALDDPETAGTPGFLMQGVTTAVYGVDGGMSLKRLKQLAELGDSDGMGINFMSYIGHNAVRSEVMGMENSAPGPGKIEAMKSLVKSAMDFGAAGLSTGLMYLPGSYATTEEVVELARVTAPYGAVYDSHVRDPAKNLLASHQECLDIGRAAGVEAHPGHIKAVSAVNFGKGPDIVKLIEDAIAAGQNVTVDLYPWDGAATAPLIVLAYPAGDEEGVALIQRFGMAMQDQLDEDELAALMVQTHAYWKKIRSNAELMRQAQSNTEHPPEGIFSWVQTVGYESMRIVVSSRKQYEGRMVTDLAQELGVSPFELYVDLIIEEGDKAMVTLGAIQEEDVQIIMKQPWAMISSDGEEVNVAHPRGRGTFPRVLGRYVRDWGVLTLEEGVYKISGLPAKYLKQKDRGVIREGAIADLAVFDPDTVIDKATWSEPALFSEGIIHVLIGGEFALRDGQVTQQRLGRFVKFDSG